MATEKELNAFKAKEFDNQLTIIRKTGDKFRHYTQIVLVRAHEEYVQAKQDFDAMARVLNAISSGLSVRTAKVCADYAREHGPYNIEYKNDPSTNTKRWYVSKDKSEEATAFKEMKIQWYNWDNKKAETELKNEEDFLKMIQRVANDKEHKRYNAKAVAVANKALTFLTASDEDTSTETTEENVAA